LLKLDPNIINSFEDVERLDGNRIEVGYEDDDGEMQSATIHLKIELCHNCEGEGSHLRTSLRNVAFSSEDEDYDPDFMDEMRQGNYDQRCEECCGEGRILVIDEHYCPKEVLDYMNGAMEAEYNYQQEVNAERRYLGGY